MKASDLLVRTNAGAGARFTPVGIVDKEVTRLRAYALLGLSDLLALSLAFASANALFNIKARVPIDHGLVILTVIAPLYIVQACLGEAYSADALERARSSIHRSVRALVLAAFEMLFISYFLKASDAFSRIVFALGMVLGLVLLTAGRLLLRRRLLAALDGSAHMIVVLRDQVSYDRVSREVVLSASDLPFDPATSNPHDYHMLAQAVAKADRLIVACPLERAVLWASVLKSLAIEGEIFTNRHDDLGAIGLAEHGNRQTIVVSTGPLNLPSRIMKRGFDLVLSVLGLLVLSPVFLVTMAAIRWESRGPILFRQDRIGRDNRIFPIFKFRSMFHEASDAEAATLTKRQDARVTRVGRFIRRTSIDELPQLLNVLRGEMSIVGPRPHALAAKAADMLYWDVDARYRHRHAIKPGLTGLAQVRGFRGNTEQVQDLTNRLHSDLEYVAKWSLWRDMVIVFKTIAVLFHRNAY